MSAEKPDSTDDNEDRTPDEIESAIEAKRDELGDTVAALVDKADVKKQARKKARDVKEQVTAKVDEVKDQASSRVDQAKEAAPKPSAPFEGSAGDIGSGPTGDIELSGKASSSRNPLVLAAGAFVLGVLIGRLTAG